MSKKPARKMETVQVQLDRLKDDDALLLEVVKELKASREFTQVFRDAMHLIVDLLEGRTDVLFQLFPELELELNSPEASGDDDLRRRVERLESLLMQERMSAGYQMSSKDPIAPYPKAFSKPKTAGPPPEEGKSDGRSADNLLNSLNNF